MTDDKPDPSLVPNGGFVAPDDRAKKAAYQTDPKWAAKMLAEAALVERCRKDADALSADNWHAEAATLRDAAAEIERMNAQLLAVRQPFTGVSG